MKSAKYIKSHQAEGVGIDIIDIRRLRGIDLNTSVWKKVFSSSEREYCLKKKNDAESLAGIFAAKEAVIKALSPEKISFQEITIHHKKRVPYCTLKRLSQKYKISVSIAHCEEYAIAICMASRIWQKKSNKG